jgi:hypothetical protein
MRSLNSTNFEQGNVDYIQFCDGSLYGKRQLLKTIQETIFQFREIEDVLKDGRNSTKWTWTRSNIG